MAFRIEFRLGWSKGDVSLDKAFRLPGTAALMGDYVGRIARFSPCRAAGALREREGASKLWLCDRERGAVLSSEKLAEALGKAVDGGTQRLFILIGGADGVPPAEVERLKPDLLWSFGPMTLAHELAAVVAAEQVYRAWSILRGAPYHLQH